MIPERDCRIACYLNDLDPEDESDWPRQHEWLAKRLNDFHRVFSQRVRALDLSSSLPRARDTATVLIRARTPLAGGSLQLIPLPLAVVIYLHA